MSLEQVIAENTIALRQVAELLSKFSTPKVVAVPPEADRGEPATTTQADRGEPTAKVDPDPAPTVKLDRRAVADAAAEAVPAEPEVPSLAELDRLVVRLVTKKGRAATIALLGEFDATNTLTLAEGKRAAFAARAAAELAS